MFEVHITCFEMQSEAATQVAQDLHWKTSQIARDPVLGDETYFYLTTHGRDLQQTITRMNECVRTLQYRGVLVVREKIEVIIHDVRHFPRRPE